MAIKHTCPNCGYKTSVKVIFSKAKGTQPRERRGLIHSMVPSNGLGQFIHRVLRDLPLTQESNGDEPDFVEWYWTTPLRKQMLREKIHGVRPSEIQRIAIALSKNDWKWSRKTLRKQGGFSDTRAFEVGTILNQEGLRTVDRQNQSHLAPHFLDYLHHVFTEAHASNNEN